VRGSVVCRGGRRPCRSVVDGPRPLCLDEDYDIDNEAMKAAAWSATEVDSRRMALAHRVCGLLPSLEGRGDECLAVVPP
jgi:hypothetical protein